ncbi:MAG: DUF7305 domain-containing protein [Planctomycetota bacterium]
MLSTLGLVIVLVAFSASTIAALPKSFAESQAQVSKLRAAYKARGGASRAVGRVAAGTLSDFTIDPSGVVADTSFAVGLNLVTFVKSQPDETVAVRVTDLGGDQYNLEAAARVGGTVFGTGQQLGQVALPRFPTGIYVDGNVAVSDKVVFDWFDSSVAPYLASQTYGGDGYDTAGGAVTMANGDVTLGGVGLVAGDICLAPAQSVGFGGASHLGDVIDWYEPFPFSDIPDVVPGTNDNASAPWLTSDYDSGRNAVRIPGGTTRELTTGTYVVPGVLIDGTLEIQAGSQVALFVTDENFELPSAGNLNVGANASLKLYARRMLNFEGKVVHDGRPEDFLIAGIGATDHHIDFNRAGATIPCVIEAGSQSLVHFRANTTIQGAIRAGSLSATDNLTVSYDVSLSELSMADVSPDGTPAGAADDLTFEIVATWRITE